MFDFLFKKKKNNNIIDNENINDEPKLVVSSIEELERMNNEVKGDINEVEKFLNEDYDKDDNKRKLVVSSIDELQKTLDEVKQDRKDDVDNRTEKEKRNEPLKEYILPTLSLLKIKKKEKVDNTIIENNIDTIQNTFNSYGIPAEVVSVNKGPIFIQYEISIKPGVRLAKINGMKSELCLALAKKDIKIEAPIPGKSTIGIEFQNDELSTVSLREVLEDIPKDKKEDKLLIAIGKNEIGKSVFYSLEKMTHLLISGASGSGKSVFINSVIATILMRAKPNEVKLVMINPTSVELSTYNGIPHLLMPVLTDSKKASIALQKIVNEMENRYDVFSEKNVKNINGYNEWVEKENKLRNEEEKISKMPFIVIIIDDLADFLPMYNKDMEDSIIRITQLGRAAGICLIMSVRANAKILSGIVRFNISSRISFVVSTQTDSKTILDMSGAEDLIGNGDMLFLPMGEKLPERVQGIFVSDEEINSIIDFITKQQIAEYDDKLKNINAVSEQINSNANVFENDDDDLYNEAVEFVVTSGKASASLLQRRFKIGYDRANHLVDLLEERGIIGPQNGSKPREVLAKSDNYNNK